MCRQLSSRNLRGHAQPGRGGRCGLRQPGDSEDGDIVLLPKVARLLYHLLDSPVGSHQRGHAIKAIQLARWVARFQNAIGVESEVSPSCSRKTNSS